MAAMTIDRLYECDAILSGSGAAIAQHQVEFQAIMSGTKGETKVKQLAAQLIPKYFAQFPSLASAAVDAVLDLAEDDVLATRIFAIRSFPLICKDQPTQIENLVNALAQLMQSDESIELETIRVALNKLLAIDAKATVTAMFNSINTAEDGSRAKVISFVPTAIAAQPELFRRPDVEAALIDSIKKTLPSTDASEFTTFISLLCTLPRFQGSPAAAAELVDILGDKAGLNEDFSPANNDAVQMFLGCFNLAVKQFPRAGRAPRFLKFTAEKVFPVFAQLPQAVQKTVLQAVAESAAYANGDDARLLLPIVYGMFLAAVPVKPAEAEAAAAVNIDLADIECVLFIFQQLAAKAPGALNPLCGIKILTGQPSDNIGADFSTKLVDFKARLSFLDEKANDLLRRNQQEISKLATTGTPEEISANRAQREQIIATNRVVKNVRALVQKLNRKDPDFSIKSGITLSWLPIHHAAAAAAAESGSSPQKRGAEAKQPKPRQQQQQQQQAGDKTAKRIKTDVYVPPHRGEEAPQRGGRGGQQQQGGGRGGRGGFKKRFGNKSKTFNQ
eukprot:TRINITY_DN2573_c0_g1_i1.p1 TRINITY_DN2573_c0_g1~~TRINITY_DN2573_c0_g1_i1.p1  ORF type:complete len:559 (-),score=193.89 TRINITY_DN2573_c0_g1_i1:66-1742(-)